MLDEEHPEHSESSWSFILFQEFALRLCHERAPSHINNIMSLSILSLYFDESLIIAMGPISATFAILKTFN